MDSVADELSNWWEWRRAKDNRDQEQDRALALHDTRLAVLETRQKIIHDNAEASRSKASALLFGGISTVVTLIVLVMQILAWRGSAP